jgi:hypothetical protein
MQDVTSPPASPSMKKPAFLKPGIDRDVYSTYKMVPPGKSFYFYSFGGEVGKVSAAETSRVAPQMRLPQNKLIKGIKVTELKGEEPLQKKIEYEMAYSVPAMNFICSS